MARSVNQGDDVTEISTQFCEKEAPELPACPSIMETELWLRLWFAFRRFVPGFDHVSCLWLAKCGLHAVLTGYDQLPLVC